MLRRVDFAFLWLLTLMLAMTATRAQFKIIGLLDTNSPLVKIASVPSSPSSAAADEAVVVEGRGAVIRDDDDDVDQRIVAHENNNDTSTGTVVSLLTHAASVADVGDKAAVIKVRIMDSTPVNETAAASQDDNSIAALELQHGRGLNDASPDATAVILPDVKPIRIYSRPTKPHIRKFAYAEERSFHKGGQNTLVSTGDEQKLKKITRYRNSFKTRCRCARISHCPRIQITIHRCEQDYFMCCF